MGGNTTAYRTARADRDGLGQVDGGSQSSMLPEYLRKPGLHQQFDQPDDEGRLKDEGREFVIVMERT